MSIHSPFVPAHACSKPGLPAVRLLAGLLIFALTGASLAQDFNYVADPPRVLLDPSKVTPALGPFCGTFICYAPSSIRSAYNFPADLDGSGQTIVIVDAFGSPTIREDLAGFDNFFHIPPPPSFSIICPATGCPSSSFNNKVHGTEGWAFETTLDVEYAHAMAPGARIVLVVANTSSGNSIHDVEMTAIQLYPGSIMSQSFGVPEYLVNGKSNNAQIIQARKNYVAALNNNITVLAAAGDFGATIGSSTANAQYPASDPLVTAVGGTEGLPYPGGLAGCDSSTQTCTGIYGGEQVWNEPNFGVATGGAPSLFFGVPAFQNGLGLTSRTTPDISYNAAVDGGVLIYFSFLGSPSFAIIGGTSAGSPQWAAIIALANQAAGHPLGYINPRLYQIAESAAYSSNFHDITAGNNQLVGAPVGFSATKGFDAASGWGTPNVANLVLALAGH